jgi:hypothetical protein
MNSVWGIDVAALLLAMVALLKSKLDNVSFLDISLTVWFTGVAMGLASLLAMNADAIAAWSPVPALVLNNVAAFLVPLFVVLGVWKPVSGAYKMVTYSIKSKLVK